MGGGAFFSCFQKNCFFYSPSLYILVYIKKKKKKKRNMGGGGDFFVPNRFTGNDFLLEGGLMWVGGGGLPRGAACNLPGT